MMRFFLATFLAVTVPACRVWSAEPASAFPYCEVEIVRDLADAATGEPVTEKQNGKNSGAFAAPPIPGQREEILKTWPEKRIFSKRRGNSLRKKGEVFLSA